MNKKAFTLIELIVVLAILAIIIGIAVPVAFGSIDASKKTVCTSNRETVRRMVPQEEALRDKPYTVDEIENFIAINKIICPSEGVFTVRKLRGAVGVDSIVVGCSKHKDGVYESRGEYLDFMQFIDENPSITSNDKLRSEFLKANNGTWPTLIVEGVTYYIQPFYSQNASASVPLEDKVWLYATTDSGTANNWHVPFVFNPATETWYGAQTWGGTAGTNTINKVNDVYALEKWLKEGVHDNGRKEWKELENFEEK